MPDSPEQDVFFISQIGADGSSERFRSDLVLNTIVKPAAREAGFRTALRADEIDRPGRITNEVIARIVDGPAVVADLTGRNPNVYYELALAHAARVPIVQLIEEEELSSIPFDVTDQNTISYVSGVFSTYEEAATRVASQLKAAVNDPGSVDNPVVTTRQFQALKAATRDDALGLPELMPEVYLMLQRLEARLDVHEISSGPSAGELARAASAGVRAFPPHARCRFVDVPSYVLRAVPTRILVEVTLGDEPVVGTDIPVTIENGQIVAVEPSDERGMAIITIRTELPLPIRLSVPGTQPIRIPVVTTGPAPR